MTNQWTSLQDAGCERVWNAIDAGCRKIVICAPTGFGKTRCVKSIISTAVDRRMSWLFLTHRKALFRQTHLSMQSDGIIHGCRASGWRDYWNPYAPGQLSMIQTEQAKRESWEPVKADIVFIDEVHANKNGYIAELCERYVSNGSIVTGVTATPVGLRWYDHLEVFATTSQARRVGAILPAKVFAPDEVDVSDIKPVSADGEYSQKKLVSRYCRPQIVGSVFKHWMKLNPEGLPAVGFGPDVAGSLWFCDEFLRRGVKCAHIDGEKVYLGEKDSKGHPVLYKGAEGQQAREDVEKMSESGEIKVVWNRFVMREGVDWPWLYHAIFATSLASPEAWIQSCGRVMRSFNGQDHCLITDHGGNVWRPGLGSPNADRQWTLDDTNSSIRKAAKKQFEDGETTQPKGCPQCGSVMSYDFWLTRGKACPECGFKFTMSVRAVYQTDGTLVRVKGNAVKKKQKQDVSDAQKAWDSVYFPSKNSKRPVSRTFSQLRHEFERNGKFKLGVHVIDDKKVVVGRHMQSGDVVQLKRVPLPDSVNWGRQVRKVDTTELQQ